MKEKSSKFKYLAKNAGVLTVAQFSSKVLTFLLVPLYTSVLTTEEYGINDLFTTTVTLLIPFLTLNIVDATVRFSLDKEIDQRKVFSIFLKFIIVGTLIFGLLLFFNQIIGIFEIAKQYWLFLLIYFFSISLSSTIAAFARGIDRITDVAVSGVISSIVLIGTNILFLLVFKMGLDGYFLSHCLAPIAQIIYLLLRIKFWNYLTLNIDKNLQKEMLQYARPMIANQVAWWINSASDRYIVTWLCGVSANGLYSVGYKIPTILAVFTNIFNQAWTLSAVHEFDPDDNDGFFESMYNLYNFTVTIACSILIIGTRLIAKFLYAKEFYEAWYFVPLLLIAFVFSSLSGYLGGIFSAVKDSKAFAKSTVIGAVINVVLNILLVNFYGAIGATIATIVSYIAIWFIRFQGAKKYIKIHFRLKRDIRCYIMLVVQAVWLYINETNNLFYFFIQFIIIIIIIASYRYEVGRIIVKIKETTKIGQRKVKT